MTGPDQELRAMPSSAETRSGLIIRKDDLVCRRRHFMGTLDYVDFYYLFPNICVNGVNDITIAKQGITYKNGRGVIFSSP